MIVFLLWPGLAYLYQWNTTPKAGIPGWAALGALLGLWFWRVSLRRQLKSRVALVATALGFLLGQLLLQTLNGLQTPAQLLGPDRWILLGQGLEAALGAWAGVAGLRILSWRWPWLACLELTAAGMIVVQALAAHREGFINRPFAVVDPLWLRGTDPQPVFLAIGGLTLLALALLAHSRPLQQHRSRWDLPVFFLLLLALFWAAPQHQVKLWLEHFGMGKTPGQDNRLGAEGQLKTPSPGEPSAQGNSSSEREPSFKDSTRQRPTPVAVVVFRDDYDPPSGCYYFRQASNSRFNGLKLVSSRDDRFDQDSSSRFPTGPQDHLGLKLPELEPQWFQRLATKVALLELHPRPFALLNPVAYSASANPDPDRFQKAYEVESLAFRGDYQALGELEAGDPNWSPEERKHYLEGPSDPRYQQLAEQILARLTPERRKQPFMRALAIKLWLDDNVTYSLHSPSAQAQDPVADYLFGQKVGYCVFTSHSACYLWRAADIPARISEGYMVPAQQRGGGSSLLIRSSDAHSWPEIYLQGVGWFELDIAPKKNLDPPQEQLDSNLQQMLGDMARKPKEEARPEEARPPRNPLQELNRWLEGLGQGFPWALLLGWLLLNGLKIFRRCAPLLWRGPGATRRAYLGVLDLLADQGQVRRQDESCQAFARRLRMEVPSLEALVELHLSQKFGTAPPPALQELRAVYRDCMAQAGRRTLKGWRAYLGWADPSSSWRIR